MKGQSLKIKAVLNNPQLKQMVAVSAESTLLETARTHVSLCRLRHGAALQTQPAPQGCSSTSDRPTRGEDASHPWHSRGGVGQRCYPSGGRYKEHF